MAVLDVSGLTMSFADKKLYDDANFQLERGEHMGVVGQNGAGKSTLIKILIGQLLPVAGRVQWQKHQDRLFRPVRRHSGRDELDRLLAHRLCRLVRHQRPDEPTLPRLRHENGRPALDPGRALARRTRRP